MFHNYRISFTTKDNPDGLGLFFETVAANPWQALKNGKDYLQDLDDHDEPEYEGDDRKYISDYILNITVEELA